MKSIVDEPEAGEEKHERQGQRNYIMTTLGRQKRDRKSHRWKQRLGQNLEASHTDQIPPPHGLQASVMKDARWKLPPLLIRKPVNCIRG